MVSKAIQIKRMHANSNASSMKLRSGGRNMEHSSKHLSTYWCTTHVIKGRGHRRQSQPMESQLSLQTKPNTLESSSIKNYGLSHTCNTQSRRALMQPWHCLALQNAHGGPHTNMYDNFTKRSSHPAQIMQ